jgi:hypothetical protein
MNLRANHSTQGANEKRRRNGFSAKNDEKARLHQTEPPNAMPASERRPGQPRLRWEIVSLCAAGSLSVMAATSPAMSVTLNEK